ncbi:hypothetical protein CHS0354_002066 [Potamilus streckersoni]|uniref:Uncharacterized protein n=1 Tax=Potamilus streckersoni TaxID=2493646 RepID=A0AAE0W6T5_9BIVA|nr:hypothetical protein CHS0354_002066 [Potamilus streckersoni]
MIDIAKKTVKLSGGASVNYERAVVSPGIDFKYDALPGITESDTGMIPHAWKAGEQTWLLQNQLKVMPDGGTFLLVSPPDPFRCPPGPYERASMVAWYLKQNKPKSKIIILDQKDKFSKQALFMDGWAAEYGEMIEWRGKGAGGTISAIDVKNKTVETELGEEKGDRAGKIAVQSGLANAAGWCPVNPLTFKSAQAKDIYVIGDAAVASEMPKSGFSANSQGKIVAAGIVRELAGKEPIPAKLANTCYSLIAPDYGISVAAVYEPNEKNVAAVKDSGGLSPKTADRSVRKQEAVYAEAWYQAITKDMFS